MKNVETICFYALILHNHISLSQLMMYCYNLRCFVAKSVLLRFTRFCVEKNLTRNCACGENKTNIRYDKDQELWQCIAFMIRSIGKNRIYNMVDKYWMYCAVVNKCSDVVRLASLTSSHVHLFQVPDLFTDLGGQPLCRDGVDDGRHEEGIH